MAWTKFPALWAPLQAAGRAPAPEEESDNFGRSLRCEHKGASRKRGVSDSHMALPTPPGARGAQGRWPKFPPPPSSIKKSECLPHASPPLKT